MLPCQKPARSFNRFDRTPACDGQTDRHRAISYRVDKKLSGNRIRVPYGMAPVCMPRTKTVGYPRPVQRERSGHPCWLWEVAFSLRTHHSDSAVNKLDVVLIASVCQVRYGLVTPSYRLRSITMVLIIFPHSVQR